MRAPGAGRKPLPTALKALQGTLQPCRTNADEPHGTPGAPTAPDHLDEPERAEWRRTCARLQALGVLKVELEDIVLVLVTSKVQVRRARVQRRKAERGADLKTARYWEAIRRTAAAEHLRACTECGLSPSALTRVRAAPPPKAAESPREARRRELLAAGA